MRRVDILVSSSEDEKNERGLTERSIRSVAAELGVSVSVSYSNWLRRRKQEDAITEQAANGDREGTLSISPYFWEHQATKAEQEYCEHIVNPGQYDLALKH